LFITNEEVKVKHNRKLSQRFESQNEKKMLTEKVSYTKGINLLQGCMVLLKCTT